MWTSIINTFLISLAPLFLWLFKRIAQNLSDKLGAFVEQKSKSQYWADTIKRVDDAAYRIVKSVYMTYVKTIKKQKGRSLNEDEKQRAKKMALAKLKSYLGAAGIKEIATIFAFDGFEAEKYLSDGIEAAVYDAKHGPRSGIGNGSINLSQPFPGGAV